MSLISFAGSPHGGSHKPLPEWNRQPRITPVLFIDHSIVGSAVGAWWYFHDRTGLESHFIIRGRRSGSADGHIWQLMDTGRRAAANWQANDKAISIETEDDGDPDTQPWSTAQLQSLIWLHNKLVSVHPAIRRREATDCDGPGLGYHCKLGAPSRWTPVAGSSSPSTHRSRRPRGCGRCTSSPLARPSSTSAGSHVGSPASTTTCRSGHGGCGSTTAWRCSPVENTSG